MMDLQTLKDTMTKRPLLVKEILSVGYSLLSQRFGQYLLLSLLVYVPVNLVTQYAVSGVEIPETFTDEMVLSTLMNSMIRVIVVEVAMVFLELIAILVAAVMVKNQLFDEENKGFGTLFYQGVRMWPRGALTTALILIGAIIAIVCASVLMVVPLIGLIAFPILVLVAFYFVMYLYLGGSCAALRGRFGFDNLRYLAFLLSPTRDQNVGGRTLRAFMLLTLLSYGVSLLVSFLSAGILGSLTNEWMVYGASVIIGSLFSIFNIFTFICGTLIFLNLEEMKRKLEVDSASTGAV